jgi:hypothetical protein
MNQQNQENKIIGILVLCGALLSIVALTITNDLEEPKTSPEESGAVFIWNDDLEGIPANGHIEIDTIINDTIYLSPVE